MSKLDDAITNTAYILDSLVALRNIQECGCCNNCEIAKFCKVKPKTGEMVRYNCPLYVEQEDNSLSMPLPWAKEKKGAGE